MLDNWPMKHCIQYVNISMTIGAAIYGTGLYFKVNQLSTFVLLTFMAICLNFQCHLVSNTVFYRIYHGYKNPSLQVLTVPLSIHFPKSLVYYLNILIIYKFHPYSDFQEGLQNTADLWLL